MGDGVHAGKIPAAVIGLGRIGSLLEEDPLREKPCTHAGAIAASGDCFLAAGMDTDRDRRDAFARTWGCPVFDSAEAMLREARPRIVHVATHPDTHLDYCLLAERCGVPVVVCEKPLADTLGKARKIAAIPKRSSTRILVNHERRYALDYQTMKAVIDSGVLGPLRSVSGTLYMGRGRPIIDVLWHDGVHLVDIAAFLFGGTAAHTSRAGASLGARSGSVFLGGEIRRRDAEAVPFCLEAGGGRDHIVFEVGGSFERGRIRIGNGVYEVWKSVESPYAAGFRSLALETGAFAGPTGYFARMIDDAARLVGDPRGEPLSSAATALGAIEYLTSVSRWRAF
ncbi:MAG: Gfo/Idh/MocA family oxidoreductase [Spirochaetaceae bacterium]|jgi:predicted dehydrogenase|nr:Gfo/Idh/MocA family oxidoreductase [Spirochaetaceae bacterium]